MNKSLIYMDHAAATPLDERVIAAMEPYQQELFYNPSANYQAAGKVRQALLDAKAEAGQWLGARTNEIIFTAGATEANNLAIHGIMRRYPDANIVVSAIEHESVALPAAQYSCQHLAVDDTGVVDPLSLTSVVDDETVIVSVMYANNEIGTIQPLKQIAQILKQIREARRQKGNSLPLYLHTDAAQAANYLDLHVARLGVDLMSLNGSKIYGPKQTGLLYVRAGITLEPLLYGGGQEFNLRSGTENVAGSIGLCSALTLVQGDRKTESSRLQHLQRQFFEGLNSLPGAHINGSRTHRLPSNVHVRFDGQDNERMLYTLDEAGIMAAAGSACMASSDEPSHVLRAIGLNEQEAQTSLRFSFGRATNAQAVDRCLSVLADLLS